MTIEREITDAILTFQSREASDRALRAAKAAVLDWLACALAGNISPTGQAMARFTDTDSAQGPGTVLLPGLPNRSARLAALVNGTLSHALEMDDIHAPALYHPGVCVIPAALAAVQEAGKDGDTFLRAVIAGYEISNRIGTAMNPGHYTYWHTTGTVGTIGAAVAACVALGLSREQCDWAIGNASTMAAGLKEAFRSDGMTKPLHAGRAAESGYLAASLARAGFTGAKNMLSGRSGLAAAMAGGTDLGGCLATLCEDDTITRSTLKRFAACGHTFAAVDAVLEIMGSEPRPAPVEIASVSVRTYAAAVEAAGNPAPTSEFEARFSIAFCVATALCGHDLARIDTVGKALEDDETRALCTRVVVISAPEFDTRFPTMRGASVTIRMLDGSELCATVPTRKGAPENPLSEREIAHKAASLISSSPFRHAADAWMTWCDGLDTARDLRHGSMPSFGPSSREAFS